jgi:hypothetical protein
VRDFLLNEALKRLAADAATHFSGLVAVGESIPFDVAEAPGQDASFFAYAPQTGRFVREREAELRRLHSFEAARDAVEEAGVAADYLEARGEAVPADPAERAAHMLTVFIASLWDGSTEFMLDRARLDAALEALDAESRDVHEAEVLIAPIVGLRMAAARLQLPSGVRVVRADTIEAPVEAMQSEGMGRAAWEPQFLALAEQGEGPEGTGEALQQLHELISVMRLYRSGGIGLGPYAFAPTAEGQWRRVATGAGATRPGGYELSEDDAAELTRLAGELEARPDPEGTLGWAVRRFELGCSRASALEGLSDHLLALRALLEGQGPVGASLPMRASALIADASLDRLAARERIEAALELERSLMAGASGAGQLELAVWAEDGVRRLLREAALGRLGTDISTAADETLIATGLAEGDAQITVAVNPEPDLAAADPAMPGSEAEDMAASYSPPPNDDRNLILSEEGEAREGTLLPPPEFDPSHQETHMEEETRIMEPIPEEDEIRITATNWLDEVSVEGTTLEWPSVEGRGSHRERVDTPRVRHLFPVPEDAEWEVRELRYDHYRRRAG